MAERKDCKWRRDPISEPVCHVCRGWVVLNNDIHCPFSGGHDKVPFSPKPEFQHLITADERLFSVQLRMKEVFD